MIHVYRKKSEGLRSPGKVKKERNVGSPRHATEHFCISDSPPVNFRQRAIEDDPSASVEFDKRCACWDTNEWL